MIPTASSVHRSSAVTRRPWRAHAPSRLRLAKYGWVETGWGCDCGWLADERDRAGRSTALWAYYLHRAIVHRIDLPDGFVELSVALFHRQP